MVNRINSADAAIAATRAPQSLSDGQARPCWSHVCFHFLIFVAAFLIVVSRRPDVVFNAQFWAEDGSRWYADAYQYGLHSILMTSVGYYVTLQRLVAVVAQWVPMQKAPLLFNVAAIVVQVLPVSLFLSRRYAFVGSVPLRILLSLAYLGLPNSTEINANLTNSQWHLALLGLMILLAPPGNSRRWAAFDLVVIFLLALTGPFSILLLPVASAIYWKSKHRHIAVLGGMSVAGALIQIMALFTGTRVSQPLGATWQQFIRITGHQVFLSALFGQKGFWLPDPQPDWYFAVLAVIVAFGTAIIIYAVERGPLQLKLFLLFSTLVFAAALISPLGQWRVLHMPGAAGRYWFFPMMGFLASLCWMALGKSVPKTLKWIAAGLALSMILGMVNDWRYPRLTDFQYAHYAREFTMAQKNTRFVIPINPPGWKMVLLKK